MNVPSTLGLPHVEHDLPRVELALRRAVHGDDPFLTQVAGHLIRAGGKRLRPALVLAAGSGAGPTPEDVVMGAVAVELVHLGSLYHDDVMDEASTRRGVESVNSRWGNLVAIVAGDFLLARASQIAADLSTEVAGLLAATIGSLCEGQVREISAAFDVTRTEAAYLASIAGKTASLMASACRIGGITAALDRPRIDTLTRLGESFGMVFQIVDDILDVTGTDEQLGKPAGHDMVEGVYTLPVIHALRAPGSGAELRALLGRPLDDPEREKALTIVRSNGAVEAACRVGRRYAEAAETAAVSLGPGPEARHLGRLGHALLDGLPFNRA